MSKYGYCQWEGGVCNSGYHIGSLRQGDLVDVAPGLNMKLITQSDGKTVVYSGGLVWPVKCSSIVTFQAPEGELLTISSQFTSVIGYFSVCGTKYSIRGTGDDVLGSTEETVYIKFRVEKYH